MLHIAICDDISGQLDLLKRSVDSFFRLKGGISYSLETFFSSKELLFSFEKGNSWDIVILDIVMPDVLGTDVARILRERGDQSAIIFTSFSSEYAVEAFSLNALHYVLKPFKEADFHEAMERAVNTLSTKIGKTLIIQMEDGVVENVNVDDIIFIESVGYRRCVHTKHGIFEEIKKTLTLFLEELDSCSPGQFIIPYRGYIINLEAVKTITVRNIVMQDGTEILLKRGDYRKIRDIFFNWSFRKEGGRI